MVVRGAPLIGVTAAYGLYLAALESDADNWCEEVKRAGENLISARPTAVNLALCSGPDDGGGELRRIPGGHDRTAFSPGCTFGRR